MTPEISLLRFSKLVVRSRVPADAAFLDDEIAKVKSEMFARRDTELKKFASEKGMTPEQYGEFRRKVLKSAVWKEKLPLEDHPEYVLCSLTLTLEYP